MAFCFALASALDLQERSVVISQLRNQNCIIRNLINKPVFVIDSSGPVTGKGMSQWFRFANTLKRIAFGFLNEGIDTVQSLFFCFLPINRPMHGQKK